MKALLVVDLQNDFCTGSLAVKQAEEIIPLANQTMEYFSTIIACQDWHPPHHKSFVSQHIGKKVGDIIELEGIQQTLWPNHCIANSNGAAFHKDLKTEKFEKIFRKGQQENIDSYSAFYDVKKKNSTGLGEWLQQKKIQKLFILGLTTDYCVFFSVLDALKEGLQVFVILDACRAVNLNQNDGKKAVLEMEEKGAKIIKLKNLKNYL